MRIGLDFDGVIVDNAAMKAERIKKRYGVSLPHAVFHRSAIMSGGVPGVTYRQYIDVKRDVYWRSPTASKMIPIAGTIGYIKRLIGEGHKIFVISSRSRRSARFARKWCEKMNLPLVRVIGVGMDRIDKSEAARLHRLEIFVDNDIEKLKKLNDVVRHKFLFTWHNNLKDDTAGIAERVFGWSDLYERVKKLTSDT